MESPSPLCINQEQLLLSRELQGSRHPTIIPIYHRITGPLDKTALHQALRVLVQRHPALRTSFHATDQIQQALREYARTGIVPPGAYVQKVADEVQVDLASETTLSDELSRGFDRETPPRLRASLFEVSSDEHMLLIVLDHLVTDGWSVRLIERELQALYCSRPVKEPEISYPDFAKWQNEAFQTRYFDRAIRYWETQWERFGDTRLTLQDFPFAVPARGSSEFASYQLTLDPDRTSEARSFAGQHKITLYMLFLAVWALVLRRLTHKDRFPVWAHFNNRVRPETHSMVGYLINTHLIGLDLNAENLLDEVRRAVLEAASHQEVPLPHCWRTIGSAPRFDEAFVMLDFRQGHAPLETEDSPIQMTRASLPHSVLPRLSKLGAYVTDYQRTIDIAFVYSSTVFPSEKMQIVVESFDSELSALLSGSRTS